MIVAVDAHAIGCQLTGNEVYIRNLLQSLGGLKESPEFIAYVSGRDVNGWVPSGFTRRVVSCNPFVRLGWDLPKNLLRDRPDLLHVQYTAPLGCSVPTVVSVHDVSFLEHPEYFTRRRALQLRWTVQRTVASAAAVLTGSEFSARAIAKAYNCKNISIIPNAASGIFRQLSPKIAVAFVRHRFGLEDPFVFTVGDLNPRKNHIGLIHAFAEMLRAKPGLPHHLVIAGQETWFAPQVYKAAQDSGAAGRIHFTGYVSDSELLHLYNACEVFVFPSFYEGFGLPVLEAMACGRPVACSDASALPEVADSAAILFAPHSGEAITRALLDLVLDAELRARMGRLGLQRSTRFSWRTAAQKTLEVYETAAGIRPGAPACSVHLTPGSRSVKHARHR